MREDTVKREPYFILTRPVRQPRKSATPKTARAAKRATKKGK